MKKISRKTFIIATLITLLSVGSASAFYWNSAKDSNPAESSPTSDTNAHSTEDQFPGPTDQERQDAEQHKDEVIRQQELENNPPSGQQTVTPVVTSASQNGQEIFASAFVPGVFEDGGSCIFTFSKGSLQVIKTVGAFANASTTSCTNASIARSEFAEAGTWDLRVSYNSPKAQGTSQPKQFTVQ